VAVHPLPSLQRELSPQRDAAATRGLRAILRERRPDVLHTHTAKAGATGRLAALLAGRARPPVTVHTFHGHVLSGYFTSRRERVFRRLERWFARTTSTLIAVSEEVRDDLVRFGVAPAERIVVVPYGFDLDGLGGDARRGELRAELGAGTDTFVVGWAGRLTPIKRPLDLVRVLRALRDDGVDALLAAVGDGEERAAVQRLARELGVADRCRLVGFRRDVADWYAAFDAFLLTSQNEGTPVAVIEALAAGRPVVATDAGGTRTVVADGESGYVTPIGDVEALAAGLGALARDPELAARLGGHGAADVRARFSLARMADEIDEVYRRALAR
jgi:glycosyltransferase involved in cell wall biosynthesis